MDYTMAPGTALVATHCAVCATPLLDALSVECGIGPTCRKKHGYDIVVDEKQRAEANQIVYQIAVNQEGPGVAKSCDRLRELGFTLLADRILDRVVRIRITMLGESIVVSSPYCEDAVRLMRSIPGRRWDGEKKVNTFPVASKAEVWEVLKRVYSGAVAIGPRGAFVVGQ